MCVCNNTWYYFLRVHDLNYIEIKKEFGMLDY